MRFRLRVLYTIYKKIYNVPNRNDLACVSNVILEIRDLDMIDDMISLKRCPHSWRDISGLIGHEWKNWLSRACVTEL